jgi:hypothetical protein
MENNFLPDGILEMKNKQDITVYLFLISRQRLSLPSSAGDTGTTRKSGEGMLYVGTVLSAE